MPPITLRLDGSVAGRVRSRARRLARAYRASPTDDTTERRYYNAASLEAVMREFEDTYGITSQDFYAMYQAGTVPDHVPRFQRHVWASFYRDVRRMRGDDFVEHARRVFAR